MTITTTQIRGARGILDWSQAELSARTGISATSIGSIENGQTTARASTLSVIQKTFEVAGIEFIGREGIKLRSNEIQTFTGQSGFWDFYEDLYRTISKDPGEVVVSNVDERLFAKWLQGDKLDRHVSRMKDIKGVTYKILIQEGDTYYLATPDYSEYRWIPKDHFSSVPFYVYGNKLAILVFKKEPTVIVLNYPMVAAAYRVQFAAMWDNALIPENETEAKA